MPIVARIRGMKDSDVFRPVIAREVQALVDMGINTFIEPCAGGLGLFIPKYLTDEQSKKKTIVLNDIDESKTKLYEVIRDDTYGLIEFFDFLVGKIETEYADRMDSNYRKYLENIFLDMETRVSEYQDGYWSNYYDCFKLVFEHCHADTQTQKILSSHIKDFQNLYKQNYKELHNLMCKCKKVEISNSGLMSVLEKYYRKKACCLFIDPPYLYTNGKYKNNAPSEQEHADIAELILKAKAKISLYLRIQVADPKRLNMGVNKALLQFYDNSFANKSFFYSDIELKLSNDTVIERIITNFEYDDAKKYIV